jgi:hypothetical protein
MSICLDDWNDRLVGRGVAGGEMDIRWENDEIKVNDGHAAGNGTWDMTCNGNGIKQDEGGIQGGK